MDIDTLKLAAKRICKKGFLIFGDQASPLTQASALEIISRIHGFRDYHEAKQRLSMGASVPFVIPPPGAAPSNVGANPPPNDDRVQFLATDICIERGGMLSLPESAVKPGPSGRGYQA